MKKLIYYSLYIFFFCFLFGCSKDDNNPSKKSEYEVTYKTIIPTGFIATASYNTNETVELADGGQNITGTWQKIVTIKSGQSINFEVNAHPIDVNSTATAELVSQIIIENKIVREQKKSGNILVTQVSYELP